MEPRGPWRCGGPIPGRSSRDGPYRGARGHRVAEVDVGRVVYHRGADALGSGDRASATHWTERGTTGEAVLEGRVCVIGGPSVDSVVEGVVVVGMGVGPGRDGELAGPSQEVRLGAEQMSARRAPQYATAPDQRCPQGQQATVRGPRLEAKFRAPHGHHCALPPRPPSARGNPGALGGPAKAHFEPPSRCPSRPGGSPLRSSPTGESPCPQLRPELPGQRRECRPGRWVSLLRAPLKLPAAAQATELIERSNTITERARSASSPAFRRWNHPGGAIQLMAPIARWPRRFRRRTGMSRWRSARTGRRRSSHRGPSSAPSSPW